MNSFRYFLATPFLVVAKVFGGMAALVSGWPVAVQSMAEMIDNGDATIHKMTIHEDLYEDFLNDMEDMEEGDEQSVVKLIERYAAKSEQLFELEREDERD